MSVAIPSPKLLSTIWSSSLHLSAPQDYERGWVADTPIIPENILAFSRQSSSALQLWPPDQHHRFVLIVNLQGAGEVRIDQKIHRVQPGEAVLLFPFQMHDYLFFPVPSIRWLFVTFETKTPLALEPLRGSIYKVTSEIARLLRNFFDQIVPGPPAPEAALKAELYFALLLKEFLVGKYLSLDSRIPGSRASVQLLEKVNKFIHANIMTPFEIKDLARGIGYSESHLRSLFRHSVQISLGCYITTMRLRKATGLLHAGAMSITEIAEACGYRSLFAFSRAFRRAYGTAPSNLRKKC